MINKNTEYDLEYLQALPLDIKILKSEQRLHEAVEIFGEDRLFLSYSGGRKSAVLLDMVLKIYPKIQIVHVKIENIQIDDYLKNIKNLVVLGSCLDGKTNFEYILRDYELNTDRIQIKGSTANDNKNRLMAWFREGCNSFDKQRKLSKPLSFWTEKDILMYIIKNELRYII